MCKITKKSNPDSLQNSFKCIKDKHQFNTKSFIRCLYVKTIRAKQAEVQFSFFRQRDQHGIIANPKANAKLYFSVTFSSQQPS